MIEEAEVVLFLGTDTIFGLSHDKGGIKIELMHGDVSAQAVYGMPGNCSELFVMLRVFAEHANRLVRTSRPNIDMRRWTQTDAGSVALQTDDFALFAYFDGRVRIDSEYGIAVYKGNTGLPVSPVDILVKLIEYIS